MDARETWKHFSPYYDSYIKDFSADLALYLKACSSHDRIVEIGCGSGRILKCLLDAGHPVTGVDISVEMLARAQTKLEGYIHKGLLTLINHDFTNAPLKGAFSLELVSYFTFNYVLDHPDRFLKNLFDSIFPHGTILIDLFYPKTRRSPDLDGQWIKDSLFHEGKTIMVMEKRTWLAKKELEERVQIFDDGGNHEEVVTHRRYYSPSRIQGLLEQAGFSAIEFCQDYDDVWRDELADLNQLSNFMVRALK